VEDHPEIISQTEFSAEGLGSPALDPYQFVSAGLYDLHAGDIGTGNEKGIAFARDGESMAGFSRVDFGKAGSDLLILPIFALDGGAYEIELYDGDPGKDGRLVTVLHYEKPSIWNVYQEERYRMPERLRGIHCLCFRMREKVHMKGFRFERQSRAFLRLDAGEADAVWGDSFRRDGKTIRDIGNNVSLQFDEMDFGDTTECGLTIRGRTDLAVNTVTIRIRNEAGEETTEAADFLGAGGEEQTFRVHTPGGLCSVTFVFLPGSAFDFESFRFQECIR
jgi:beta-galactosidase